MAKCAFPAIGRMTVFAATLSLRCCAFHLHSFCWLPFVIHALPEYRFSEAARVFKPGGQLVVCDADFSKASLASFPDDPLDACAKMFVREFVTDPHLVAKMRKIVGDAGFEVEDFALQSRLVADNEQMLAWVEETGKLLLQRGNIGQELFAGLIAEYRRRAEVGQLYGYQVFATAVARLP